MRASLVFAVLAATVAGVAADDVERGHALARSGHWAEAIVAFKRADARAPESRHACLIGLAYLRRDLLTQAHYYIDQCRTRGGAVPDWLPLAEAQLRARIANARLAPVTVRVAGSSDARVTLGLAPDEQFVPSTLYLPLGKHLVTVTANGATTTTVIELTDIVPRDVVLRSRSTMPPPRAALVAATVIPERSSGRRGLSLAFVSVGAATLVGGVAYHWFAFGPARDALAAAPDAASYDAREHRFDQRRQILFGMYGAGAAVTLTGLLLYRAGWTGERRPEIAARVGRDATTLTLEWRR